MHACSPSHAFQLGFRMVFQFLLSFPRFPARLVVPVPSFGRIVYFAPKSMTSCSRSLLNHLRSPAVSRSVSSMKFERSAAADDCQRCATPRNCSPSAQSVTHSK